GINTSDGVLLFLTPEAGSREQLLATLRCHRAYMMLDGQGMDDCPLDVEGLEIEAYGDASGVTVELSTRSPRLVDELQRRAARELEAAARGHEQGLSERRTPSP